LHERAGVSLASQESTMPLYEFLCRKCNKEFTLVMRLEKYEHHDVACPHCKSKEVEQAVTGVSVITSKKS
jgi:putative FmdB family regulatory protein